jgi:hypothetical protein
MNRWGKVAISASKIFGFLSLVFVLSSLVVFMGAEPGAELDFVKWAFFGVTALFTAAWIFSSEREERAQSQDR